jgi:hypothetical protein
MKFNNKLYLEPFSITFSWKDQSMKIQLQNGEDILKLAKLFSDILQANGIVNTIEFKTITNDA